MRAIKSYTKLQMPVFLSLILLICVPYTIHSQNIKSGNRNLLIRQVNSDSVLDKANIKAFFANPPIVFKPRPLWFWNNSTITSAGITEQMQKYKDNSGYGGFGILPFGGNLLPKYLGDDYFTLYGVAVKKANELGLKLCIYNEYGFPSGSVGAMNGDGIPRLMNKYPDATIKRLDKIEATVIGPRAYSRSLPAGTLMSIVAMNTVTKERIDLTSTAANGTINWNVPEGSWKFMIFVCVKDGDPNVDYLDPDAVDKFIEMAQQPYYDHFK